MAAKDQRGRTRGCLPTDAGPERKESGCGPWWRPAPPHQAAAVLGRNVNSVRVQASRLGLEWHIHEGQMSVWELAGIFGVDIRWVMRRINRKTLRAVTPYGRRPGLRQVGLYRVAAQAVRSYLMSHANELQGRRVDLARIAGIMAGPGPEPR